MKANELSCKDLMVGDWVMVYPWDETPWKPKKITDINFHSWEGADFCDSVGVEGWDELSLDQIKPIPLTPDILEKNGWIKTKYAYGRDCLEIHGTDELPEGIDNALSMARWSIDKNFQYHFLDLYMWKGCVMQHNVHYVHQLQHAFKIFGIEKEIVL